MNELGPVDMGRLKVESQRVFDALNEGRRVLVSRRGIVFCVIAPASDRRFDPLLADYARGEMGEIAELTSAAIVQGSAPQVLNAVHDSGRPALVTRRRRVIGVIERTSDSDGREARAREQVERQLAQWERTNPDSTPDEFEKFSDSVLVASPMEPMTG